MAVIIGSDGAWRTSDFTQMIRCDVHCRKLIRAVNNDTQLERKDP